MIKKSLALLLLCVSALANTCLATDGISCTGKVATIGVHGTDRVILRLEGMNAPVQICNLGVTIGTAFPITAEQCKASYATLVTGFSLGAVMNVHFDNVATGTNCTNFSAWEVATARWVHLDAY